jgi:transcriptional regulator with XRE-family HTH domain
MTIEEIKKTMKARKITYEKLSQTSHIPLNTLKNIFRGKTQNPRIDTMQAIENALGINNELPKLSTEEKELIELIKQMTDEETKELSNYIDYIVSKRK